MIVLFIIAWILCTEISYGVMMHVQPDEWTDEPILCMLICVIAWPILAFIGLMYLVMKQLSKIGMFFSGFIDKMFERKGDKE